MICKYCGGSVEWQGPLMALTHTQCTTCHAVNSQIEDDEEAPYGDEAE